MAADGEVGAAALQLPHEPGVGVAADQVIAVDESQKAPTGRRQTRAHRVARRSGERPHPFVDGGEPAGDAGGPGCSVIDQEDLDRHGLSQDRPQTAAE